MIATGRRFLARPWVQDAVTAAALATVALIGLTAHLDVDLLQVDTEVFRHIDALGIGLVLLQTGPIALRRMAPVVILAITGAALMTFSLRHYPPSLASFGFVMALYTVAAYRDRRVSIPAGIGAAFVVLVILVVGQQPIAPDTIVADYLIVGAAWFLGEGLRLRRTHVVWLEDRATRLEHERELRAQEAVAQERQVIARELHDVVAHNVSVIVAQAGAAQRIHGIHPEQSLTALGAIEDSGREALVEMRRLTGFLRTDDDHSATRDPQPGLSSLERLIAQVGDAGVPVSLTIEGRPRPVPAGLDLSAYRIVQEALTNILKHAGPASARVVVRYGDSHLDLTIDDDGTGLITPVADGVQTGFGHLGMRERVALFGGELHLGDRPGGGYRVHASLPLNGELW